MIYELIEKRLYQRGRAPRLTVEQKRELLRNHDISHVVMLRGLPDQDWLRLPVDYHHWPFPDSKTAPLWLAERARWLAYELKRGHRVLLYGGGATRSGILATLVVRAYWNCSGETALEYVRTRRPKAAAPFEHYLRTL